MHLSKLYMAHNWKEFSFYGSLFVQSPAMSHASSHLINAYFLGEIQRHDTSTHTISFAFSPIKLLTQNQGHMSSVHCGKQFPIICWFLMSSSVHMLILRTIHYWASLLGPMDF